MEKKELLLKCKKVALATFRWFGFVLMELILTGFNLLAVGCVIYYVHYVTGDKQHIEPEAQVVSIKKVHGFYLIQDEDYGGYVERTFPDCTVKFRSKMLQLKDGDVYDGRNKVTDQVEIQWTKAGFMVYYQNKSYPLRTLTKFDASYKNRYGSVKELKEMYAKGGRFYIDVDNRHWIMNLGVLIFVLAIVLFIRYAFSALNKKVFEKERDICLDFIWDITDVPFRKKKKEEN